MEYEIHDLSLAGDGKQRIAWAARQIPFLSQVAAEFVTEQTTYQHTWSYGTV